MEKTTAAPTVQYRSAQEVQLRYGVSASSLWRWVKEGIFPKPVYFGSRRRWNEADLVAWEARRRAAGGAGDAGVANG
jgi:predicted DNA-binding transcriptional regulator AlpA